jgi:hypothetical protein
VLIWPSLSVKYAINTGEDRTTINGEIHNFRKKYLEAFVVTIACIIAGYLLAGWYWPSIVPWNKLIPTFLIALPVEGASFATASIRINIF